MDIVSNNLTFVSAVVGITASDKPGRNEVAGSPANTGVVGQRNPRNEAHHLFLLHQVTPQVKGPARDSPRRDTPQQGGLAHPVCTDQTVPTAVAEPESGPVQQLGSLIC